MRAVSSSKVEGREGERQGNNRTVGGTQFATWKTLDIVAPDRSLFFFFFLRGVEIGSLCIALAVPELSL